MNKTYIIYRKIGGNMAADGGQSKPAYGGAGIRLVTCAWRVCTCVPWPAMALAFAPRCEAPWRLKQVRGVEKGARRCSPRGVGVAGLGLARRGRFGVEGRAGSAPATAPLRRLLWREKRMGKNGIRVQGRRPAGLCSAEIRAAPSDPNRRPRLAGPRRPKAGDRAQRSWTASADGPNRLRRPI